MSVQEAGMYGVRVGRRYGRVRLSAGRRGVRVSTGRSSGRARAGVSYSTHGFGYGASYGSRSSRIGTNGHRVSAGVTGKTGVISYGVGVRLASKKAPSRPAARSAARGSALRPARIGTPYRPKPGLTGSSALKLMLVIMTCVVLFAL